MASTGDPDHNTQVSQTDPLEPALGPGHLRPGQPIGKCRIERLLGQGGMGAVYLARHQTLAIPVAIKVMSPELMLRHPEFGQRFMREGRLAARLQHPCVVRVLDADRDPRTGLYYILQEYVPGGSLYEQLERGPLPESEALRVVSSIAEALVAAEKIGIIHRDIKPHNILVSEEGAHKLADLGLAREAAPEGSDLTRTDGALGTPAYMSPEQVRSPKHVDIRSDIYSLGATLYHLLTGRPPFGGETLFAQMHAVVEAPVPDPRALRPELSAAAAALCMRMMAKQPEDRFEHPAELVAAARQPALLTTRPARPRRALPRRPAWPRAAVLGGAVLVLVTVLGTRWLGGPSAPEPPGRQPGATGEAPAVGRGGDGQPEPDSGTRPARENGRSASPTALGPANGTLPARKHGGSSSPTPPPPTEGSGPQPPRYLADLAGKTVLALRFDPRTGSVSNLANQRDGAPQPEASEGLRFAPADWSTPAGQAIRTGTSGFLQTPPLDRICAVAFCLRATGRRPAILLDTDTPRQKMAGLMVGLYADGTEWGHWPGHGSRLERGLFVGLWQIDLLLLAEIQDKQWHHVVVSIEGDRVSVLVDGQAPEGFVCRPAHSASQTKQPFLLPQAWRPRANAPITLGRLTRPFRGLEPFTGQLDEVAAWNEPLTRQQMTWLHKQFKARKRYCEALGRIKRRK